MLDAISRYGTRVIPAAEQSAADLDRRGQLIEGPLIAEFERAFADRVGVPHTVATSYGRMAFKYLLTAHALPRGAAASHPSRRRTTCPAAAKSSCRRLPSGSCRRSRGCRD